MDFSTPGFPVHHQLPELAQTPVHQVGDAFQPSHPLCHPLVLPPSIFPSIRVFSNESVLHIRWPKYWSFSFSISPSNEYAGLICFRMDWLDHLAVQGILFTSSNFFQSFPGGSAGKESTCNVGDLGSVPGLGRSPGEENGYPLQYSGPENYTDCIVHGVTKSQP